MMRLKETNTIHPMNAEKTASSPADRAAVSADASPNLTAREAATKTAETAKAAATKTAEAAKVAASKTAEAARTAKTRITEAKKAASEVEGDSDSFAATFEAVRQAEQQTPAEPAGVAAAASGQATDGAAPAEQKDTSPAGQVSHDAEVFGGNLKSAWLSYYPKHRNAVIYGLLGFIVAILILTVGFWPILLVVLLTAAGVIYGRYQDGNPKVCAFFDHLFRRGK